MDSHASFIWHYFFLLVAFFKYFCQNTLEERMEEQTIQSLINKMFYNCSSGMFYFPVAYPYFFVPVSSLSTDHLFVDSFKSQQIGLSSEPKDSPKIQGKQLPLEAIKQEEGEEKNCQSLQEKFEREENFSQKSKDNSGQRVNYPMKNTQSNLVNQVFSFLNNQQKTGPFLKSYLKDVKKIKSFYQTIKSLKKYKKKYVNRKYLEKLCMMKENETGYKMLIRSLKKMNILAVKEFQTTAAILIIHYLKQMSDVTILTSRKLNSETINDHLKRKRQICISLQNTFATQQ